MNRQDAQNTIAEILLKPISKYYDQENLEEVVINRFNEIATKKRGEDWVYHEDTKINHATMLRICTALSNINRAKFSEEEMPVVSCDIPNRKLRYQSVMGPNVKYDNGDNAGICVAIRSLEAREMTFDKWGLTPDSEIGNFIEMLKDFEGIKDNIQRIQEAINSQETIIVSGPTSTGKTTFTNGLIKMIHENARIVSVEDVIELTIPHRNRVRLMVQRNNGTSTFKWNEAVNALMRLTPDWIICGELSVENASTIFSLMGKGHPVITTVHAKTPKEAQEAFISNMSAAGSNLDPVSTLDQLESRIGCIIQINRDSNHRRHITDIVFPSADRLKRNIINQEKEKMQQEQDLKNIMNNKEKNT